MKHDPRLDGIRALAVLAVALFHGGPLRGGTLGVDVFFVLSGYLITSLLLAEAERDGRIDLAAFMLRRAKRLLPALLALLAVYALASSLAPWLWPKFAAERWVDIAAAAGQVMNLREGFWATHGPLSHAWSLSLEMQFYLLWPLLVVRLRRLPRRRIIAVLLGSWAVISVARTGAFVFTTDDIGYFVPPFHATGLILGSALAFMPNRPGRRVGWIGLLATVGLAFIPHNHGTLLWRPALCDVAAAMLIAAPPRFLAIRPLTDLGVLSYGVYLWHIPVLLGLWMFPEDLRRWLFLPLAIAFAALSYLTVEAPFRRRTPAKALRPAADGAAALTVAG